MLITFHKLHGMALASPCDRYRPSLTTSLALFLNLESCAGDWESYVNDHHLTRHELAAFLDFCGLFLTNIGNYYVSLDC
jgi:hypothetical protein